MELRSFARSLFLETMRQADVRRHIALHVRCVRGWLYVGDARFRLLDFSRILVLAVGKAATPMSDCLTQILRPHLHSSQSIDGIVVGDKATDCHPELRYFLGSHPIPDDESRASALAMMAALSHAGEETLVLYLISGGASAMLETPFDSTISMADVASFYKVLIHSGLSIGKINILRKYLSAVKGGRLAALAPRATQYTLLVSDVPHGMEHLVGSGPSLPNPSTVDDCRQILRESNLMASLPASIASFFQQDNVPETPRADSMPVEGSYFTLLSSDILTETASSIAGKAGFTVVMDNTCDDWDYHAASKYLLERLADLRLRHDKVCLLSAGEVTVVVSGDGGVGGRNQHFVLETARSLSGSSGTAVLSAGSDGIDGNSPAAGAIGDGSTWERAIAAGLDPKHALESFDSYPIFAALDDVIVIGRTGSNIRDIRMLLACATDGSINAGI
jgi:glycerate 2-kinase